MMKNIFCLVGLHDWYKGSFSYPVWGRYERHCLCCDKRQYRIYNPKSGWKTYFLSPNQGDRIRITHLPSNNASPTTNCYIGSEGVVDKVYKNGGFELRYDSGAILIINDTKYKFKVLTENKPIIMKKPEALQRLSAIEAETKELRKIIESEEKQGPILDRLHSFEDACRIKGVLPNDIVRFPNPKNDWEIAKNAEDQLEFIIEVAVEDWVCNWNDSNQKKWIPVFDFSSAGFVFSLTFYDFARTYSGLGSRLPTSEMATIIGKRFIHLYKLILTKPKRK